MYILNAHQSELYLKKEGLPVTESKLINNKNELLKFSKKIGFPVALKNPFILHKTEKNAVIIDTYDFNLIKNYNALKTKKILVQKQVNGIELLIGLKKDKVFGHVLAFGLGGIYTEAIKDVAFRICPLTKKDSQDIIKEIKSHEIFTKRKKINTKRIENIILKVSNLVRRHPNIKELDINPLMVNEKEVKIVDARIILD